MLHVATTCCGLLVTARRGTEHQKDKGSQPSHFKLISYFRIMHCACIVELHGSMHFSIMPEGQEGLGAEHLTQHTLKGRVHVVAIVVMEDLLLMHIDGGSRVSERTFMIHHSHFACEIMLFSGKVFYTEHLTSSYNCHQSSTGIKWMLPNNL